jgi:hypothetical protein
MKRLSILLLILCSFGVIACESVPAGTSTPIPTPTPISIEVVDTVGNIIELYESNEIAAEAMYTDKWADITGQVEGIESKGDRIEINLKEFEEWLALTTVVCKIPEEHTQSVMNLRKDDVVTVRGKILGVPGFSNVVVEPCRVLR